MKTPEGYEKKEIDEYLKSIGAYVVKPATFGYGASGTSDRVCCWRGRFFVVEVKREGKEPTAKQEERMAEVEKAGGKAFWGTAEKVIPEIREWINPRAARKISDKDYEICLRRFGSQYPGRPCADLGTLECAIWECQVNDRCRKLP